MIGGRRSIWSARRSVMAIGAMCFVMTATAACALGRHHVSPETPQEIARRISLLDVPDSTRVLVFDSENSELTGHGRTQIELALSDAQGSGW
jgi:hypothetical protein